MTLVYQQQQEVRPSCNLEQHQLSECGATECICQLKDRHSNVDRLRGIKSSTSKVQALLMYITIGDMSKHKRIMLVKQTCLVVMPQENRETNEKLDTQH